MNNRIPERMWPQVAWLLKALVGKPLSPVFNIMISLVSLHIENPYFQCKQRGNLHWFFFFNLPEHSKDHCNHWERWFIFSSHSGYARTHWWPKQPEPLKFHWIVQFRTFWKRENYRDRKLIRGDLSMEDGVKYGGLREFGGLMREVI